MSALKNYLYFFILIKLSLNLPQCPTFNPNLPPVFFPHEYDCRLFYRCEESGAVLMQCWPPGTHWSTQTNRCEWEAVANCNLPGSPIPSTTSLTTTFSPTTTITTTLPPTTTTTLPPTTTTTLPPTTTTTLPPTTTTTLPPTTTTTLPPTTTTLPPTTTTEPRTTTLSVTPPTIPTAPTGGTIQTTTTLRPTTTTTQPQNPCPPVDDPNNIIFLEDPDDCSAYFMCFNRQKVRRQCVAPLLWNQEFSWCDFPSNVQCRSCPPIDNPNRLIFFPHATDCTRYYLCFNATKIERQCHARLFWDDRYSWCDFAENVLCTNEDFFKAYSFV